MKIQVGCTVRRYVVTRCTFDENHVYDLALTGHPVAYDRIGSPGNYLNPKMLTVPEETIHFVKTYDLCIHRTVTIHDVNFQRFFRDGGGSEILNLVKLQRGKDTKLEHELLDHYSGPTGTGPWQAFTPETKLMLLNRYGVLDMNKNRIQIFGFPKLEM